MKSEESKRLLRAIAKGNLPVINNQGKDHPLNLITGYNVVAIVDGEQTITKTVEIKKDEKSR